MDAGSPFLQIISSEHEDSTSSSDPPQFDQLSCINYMLGARRLTDSDLSFISDHAALKHQITDRSHLLHNTQTVNMDNLREKLVGADDGNAVDSEQLQLADLITSMLEFNPVFRPNV